MNADRLIDRLEQVIQTGPGNWRARCPAHDSSSKVSRALSVRELDDRLTVKCFAGCNGPDILAAVGMSLADLYPDRGKHVSPEKWTMLKRIDAALSKAERSAMIILLGGSVIQNGEKLDDKNLDQFAAATADIIAARQDIASFRKRLNQVFPEGA